MLRKLTIIAAALQLLLGLAVVGLSWLFTSIENDVFRAGPTSAAFVDRAVGLVDPSTLRAAGELLLTSEHRLGLAARPLDDSSRAPLRLFSAVSVSPIAPGGRHVSAWIGDRWQVIRLADLHAVAEIQGAEPFFLDSHRVLVVFRGDRCGRRDATILDLRDHTRRTIDLSGDKAGLIPLTVAGSQVIAERIGIGDSSCAAAGFAAVNLQTGVVKTMATAGSVLAVTPRHVWIDDYEQTKVFGRNGALVATFPSRVTAEAVEGGVIYAELPPSRADGLQSIPATRLRLGAPTGPTPNDAAGDELVDPREISVVQDGAAVLVAHRGSDLPEGGHATLLSRCAVPDLRCQPIVEVSGESPLGIVPAEVFAG